MKSDEVIERLKIVTYPNLFFFSRKHIFQLNQLIWEYPKVCVNLQTDVR